MEWVLLGWAALITWLVYGWYGRPFHKQDSEQDSSEQDRDRKG